MIPLHTGFDFVAFEAQGLELQSLSLVGLAHRNDVVQLAGLRSDGRRACTSHPVLPAAPLGGCWCCPDASAASAGSPLGSPRPAAALGRARPGAASTPAAPAHPRRARESRSRLPTLAGAGRTIRRVLGAPPFGLVPRCEQLGPHASQVFAPEVATTDLPGPGLPLREFGSAGVLALPTVAMPLRFVAPHHGPGAFVKESVSVPGGVGYGPFFLLHGLEAIQEPASAIDEEHRGVAPDAEGSDLCRRNPPLPPVAGTDGIEVLQDVLYRETFRSSASCRGTQSMSERFSKALARIWSPAKSW